MRVMNTLRNLLLSLLLIGGASTPLVAQTTRSTSAPAIGAGSFIGFGATVRVAGDEVFVGIADGPEDSQHRARLVGEATLRAVEEAVNHASTFDLTAVATTDLGPVKVALAQVRDGAWSDYLVGSALVREADPSIATAKAVHDALKRHITQQRNPAAN